MSGPSDSPPTAAGDPFGREALARPAIRAKLWLLAAAPVAAFRSGLMSLLGLPAECRIELRRLAGASKPPDLCAVHGGAAIAIIDTGRGGLSGEKGRAANAPRGMRASRHGLPLYILAARKREAPGASWAAVRKLALDTLPMADPQGAVNLTLLAGAIDEVLDHAEPARRPRPAFSADVAQNPWMKAACAPLLDPRMARYVAAEGFAQGSAAIRLTGPKHCVRQGPRRKGVLLAVARATQEDQAFLAAPEALRADLAPHLEPWIAAWDAMLRSVAPGGQAHRKTIRVSTGAGGVPAAAVAALFAQLTTALLARREA
jgi:hypothetical protein